MSSLRQCGPLAKEIGVTDTKMSREQPFVEQPNEARSILEIRLSVPSSGTWGTARFKFQAMLNLPNAF